MNEHDFEWDARKAARNLEQHKIPFELARYVFDDPGSIEEPDDRDYGEDRFNVIGCVGGRILFVTYTMHGRRIRLVSARPAEPHERRRYHEKTR